MVKSTYNLILKSYQDNGWYALSFDSSDEIKKAHRELVSDGLLVPRNRNSYRLSEIGIEAIRLGGYEIWLENKKIEKVLDSQNKILTNENLERSIFQLKNWWVLLLLNAVISFIVAYFTK